MDDLEPLPVRGHGGDDPAPGAPAGAPAVGPSRRAAPLAAGLAVLLGALAVVILSRDGATARPGGSGFVFACDLAATTAVIRFDRLPDEVVEVHVDLRGDIAMIPLTGDQAMVTTGRSRGHQSFVPSESGELALMVPLLSRPPHRARLVEPGDGEVILDLALPTLRC